jgi:hypothetical protein
MLKQQIQNETKEAMKSGDQFVVVTLRMLSAAIASREKEKRYKASKDPAFAEVLADEGSLEKASQLAEEEVIEVVSSEIKKRKDAAELYQRGNRPELAEKEKKEIEILRKYLPAQLSYDEIKKMVEESVGRLGAKEIKDMGKVMADLNQKIKGKADGGEVSKIVKELLSIK